MQLSYGCSSDPTPSPLMPRTQQPYITYDQITPSPLNPNNRKLDPSWTPTPSNSRDIAGRPVRAGNKREKNAHVYMPLPWRTRAGQHKLCLAPLTSINHIFSWLSGRHEIFILCFFFLKKGKMCLTVKIREWCISIVIFNRVRFSFSYISLLKGGQSVLQHFNVMHLAECICKMSNTSLLFSFVFCHFFWLFTFLFL